MAVARRKIYSRGAEVRHHLRIRAGATLGKGLRKVRSRALAALRDAYLSRPSRMILSCSERLRRLTSSRLTQ